MKNTLLFLLLLLNSNLTFSQDISELKLTNSGVEHVTLDFGSLTSNEIYEKSIKWLHESFINPKDVLKENVENQKIKIEGFSKKAWWYKSMGIKNYNHMQYTVLIYIKNKSVVFEYKVGQFYMLEGSKTQYSYRMFFAKNGSIRKQYVDAVSSLELTMNSLLISYYNYITGKSVQVATKDLNKYLSTLQASLSKDAINPSTLFELACFYSLIEDRKNAYKHLSDAVNYGYKKTENIQIEPDLKWLRSQDDFKEYVSNGYKFGTPKATMPNNNKSTTNYIEELKELALLKDQGIITEKEFNQLKAKILERVKSE